ncbi:peptide chain release factor-like protein [Flavobacterium cauense R2A-7]|uniref:Peptide chain release factor n=1 Tax=Flavobacterium cauense R2A-7 TaxID=1341154 RepID=V6S203_9FLAO|nr:peptide chain release factor H [Flavobacterium cauense]ESU20678.1 peptide chain release factor-like protein [Flavobacterium cauense R2A-7]KGO82944.1 peptide chain release factor H [Flavobacterium cauense R2A-7]TWI10775.1 peptide chain release factor [Flavobacterium cauense R2A-7]
MEKIIQITSGRGPAECTWVVAQVLKKVLQEAAAFDLKANVLQHEAGSENGTVESAIVLLEGKEVNDFVKSWTGTIQWIGQSSFRKFHKRKNWFIGIFEIEKTKEMTFSEKEIQYQAMRSSGAGGQHVNKVSSAIRATHLPTGLSVVSMDSRSQHQNKKLATERLVLKIQKASLSNIKAQFQSQWMNQMQIERGNPIRIFEGSDFKKQKETKKNKVERQRLKRDLEYEINR